MNKRIECIVANVKGPRVLDVGAASADPDPKKNKFWLHQHIHKAFPDTIGIDLNAENVKKLQALGWNNIVEGNAETYETDVLFDTIVAGELIEHVTSPANFLENMVKKLSSDGRIVITTPNPFAFINVGYAIRHYPQTCSHWEHTVWFCPTTISQLVERVGLQMVSVELLEDYRTSPSKIYMLFSWFIKLFGWMVPKVLRCNCFICVLEIKKD